MTIGLDLTLITIDPVSGRARFGPAVAYALAVGELLDLALLGRVELRDDHLIVQYKGPVGEPLLEQALIRLAEAQSAPPTVSQWVAERGPWRIDAYIAGLEEAGALRLVPTGSRAGGKRIEVLDTLRIHGAVERLSNAIAGGDSLPYEEQAFAALTAAAGCARDHLRGWDHRADRKQLRDLSRSACRNNDGDAVARTILRQGIQTLRTLAKHAGASSRTIDQQIGLTQTGWWASGDNLPP
ncbi:GOLPH3/VPS74 family protein [Catenulispora rubra]|uniref:GOLPH3/VPS74 family protein n=1 Tax=Catenulispora rubra TaxID=280293 RepID=UPI0018926B59|nr:GPP34 family phosphoprotein [Catenulispora rubra]